MPDVNVTILDVSSTDGAPEKVVIETWDVPREHWDIEAVERQLESDGWFGTFLTLGYDPIAALASQIHERCEEYDGMNLDIHIKIGPVSEEQRNFKAESRLGSAPATAERTDVPGTGAETVRRTATGSVANARADREKRPRGYWRKQS